MVGPRKTTKQHPPPQGLPRKGWFEVHLADLTDPGTYEARRYTTYVGAKHAMNRIESGLTRLPDGIWDLSFEIGQDPDTNEGVLYVIVT